MREEGKRRGWRSKNARLCFWRGQKVTQMARELEKTLCRKQRNDRGRDSKKSLRDVIKE